MVSITRKYLFSSLNQLYCTSKCRTVKTVSDLSSIYTADVSSSSFEEFNVTVVRQQPDIPFCFQCTLGCHAELAVTNIPRDARFSDRQSKSKQGMHRKKMRWESSA